MKYDTINELKEDFLLAMNMSSAPDFCKVKPDHIFDEDKSVRWNREEAIRVNNEYDAKCKILRAKRDATISLIIDRIKKYISINVGCSLHRAFLCLNSNFRHTKRYLCSVLLKFPLQQSR
jgi:hypothetical protein